MLVDELITRLKAEVADLNARVDGAANLTEMMRSGGLPQVTPAAFVIPLGLQGGAPDVAVGLYRQKLRETIGVVLVIRSNDRSGQRALDRVEALINAINTAICGWAPVETLGVFQLAKGGVVSMTNGTFVYQLDYALNTQLRIAA